MDAGQLALTLMLGLGLAASTGLNASLPLLLLAGAAKFHIAGITLNGSFGWLRSDVAIFVLIVAAILEIVGDKIPAVDHFLDAIGTFIRPAAGGVAVASVLTHVDPVTAAVIGLMIGSPVSFGFHTVKAATRVGSSAITFGCGNPVLSVIEDVLSVVLSIAAIFTPILVPLLVILMVLVGFRILNRVNRRGQPVPADRSGP
ncbi:MAG TPA: DUF4126 domain-containing protein [Thermoanaerobaculia bacterium]|jgi:hypothetical protein